MSSIYRVNYQMRPHRRDTFVEFIKALLLNPFILHAASHKIDDSVPSFLQQGYAQFNLVIAQNKALFKIYASSICSSYWSSFSYADVMLKLEKLIQEHLQQPTQSHLQQLVPTLTTFFT